MNETHYLIAGTVYLVAVIALLYGPWQRLMIDMARQRLFELRDEVFDLAAVIVTPVLIISLLLYGKPLLTRMRRGDLHGFDPIRRRVQTEAITAAC